MPLGKGVIVFAILLGLSANIAVVHAALPRPIAYYISPDDYPAAAWPSKAEGKVEFRLGIDALGRVTDCEILASSGSSVLDRETCQILHRRLKLVPARDETGAATSDVIDASFEWHLPSPEQSPH